MGRRRFQLANMMPNSWFYKLRDMRRPRSHPPAVASGEAGSAMLPSSSPPPPPPQRGARYATRPASPRRGAVALPHRTSYYYATRDREVPAPEPRDVATEDRHRHRQLLTLQQQSPPSSSRRRQRVGAVRVGRGLEAKALAGAHDAHQSRRRDMYVGRDGSSDEDDDVDEVRRPAVIAPSEYSMSGKMIASETDIVIDLCSEGTAERVLRPIVTRPAMREVVRCEVKDRHVVDTTPAGGSSATEQGSKSHPRRPSVSTGRRLRTRVNSPRLASTTSTRSRKSSSKPTTPGASPRKASRAPPPPALAESFAVVKSSADPRRDFRESMEEMIAEQGIRDAADLEDLLACYLALNAAEHHGLIVEVFEEIWASLAVTVAGADP